MGGCKALVGPLGANYGSVLAQGHVDMITSCRMFVLMYKKKVKNTLSSAKDSKTLLNDGGKRRAQVTAILKKRPRRFVRGALGDVGVTGPICMYSICRLSI